MKHPSLQQGWTCVWSEDDWICHSFWRGIWNFWLLLAIHFELVFWHSPWPWWTAVVTNQINAKTALHFHWRDYWLGCFGSGLTVQKGSVWEVCCFHYDLAGKEEDNSQLEIVGEWVMNRRPFWIKIMHISPILLGRFCDKKSWKLLSVLCSLWGIYALENLQGFFFTADTAVCNVLILPQISLNT